MIKAAVFLDRDGVLNRAVLRDGKPHPPQDLSELVVLPGVEEGLKELKGAGYALVVVTNQPDVARGTQSRTEVDRINAALAAKLPLDEFRVCFHDDADACECRKPKPGLILRPPVFDCSQSFLIGDRWRDIEAGRNAGCRTILIDHHYDETVNLEPDARVASFSEAAEWILRETKSDAR